jgi:tryptophan 7-halogenase
MTKTVAIIGAGTAGILSACYCCSNLGKGWAITSIYDPSKKILGIGESSNPSFISALEEAINFNIHDDLPALDATHKFGTKFINWRKNDYLFPLIEGNCAIHFNNFKLQELVFPRLKKAWPKKFSEILGSVSSVENKIDYVEVVVDNVTYEFDYVIDCRGFPEDYSDYHIEDRLPVNHCLVHNFNEPGEWKYTGHRAHQNGWMFEIPLTTRKSYGYLYNDSITTKDHALDDFSKEIGIDKADWQGIEYKFKPFYSKNVFDGRIMKNGNRAIFFEPISATSIFSYDQANRIFIAYLIGQIKDVETVNKEFTSVAEAVIDIICYFYHGGSNYDTDFWKYAQNITTSRVKDSKMLRVLVPEYKEALRRDLPKSGPTWFWKAKDILKFSEAFGYNYFKGNNNE